MIIERDLPIRMDDGAVLRADIYRPDATALVPVIMTSGPYGKGVRYQEHYKLMWDWLIEQHPDLLSGSTRSYLTWETVDPEIWVPWGYAVVRVDSRGAGRSPGYLDIFSARETLDYYHAIEWAGTQPWANGKVGLSGISYYAINQWHVAQLQPPHLTAMIPWRWAGYDGGRCALRTARDVHRFLPCVAAAQGIGTEILGLQRKNRTDRARTRHVPAHGMLGRFASS